MRAQNYVQVVILSHLNSRSNQVQEGVALPAATFSLQLGGRQCDQILLYASAAQLHRQLMKTFPDVLSARVFALDNEPGLAA